MTKIDRGAKAECVSGRASEVHPGIRFIFLCRQLGSRVEAMQCSWALEDSIEQKIAGLTWAKLIL